MLTDVGVNILRVGVQATSNAEQVIKPGTMKNAQTGAAAIWEWKGGAQVIRNAKKVSN